MNEKYNPASLRAGYRAMQYILLIYLYLPYWKCLFIVLTYYCDSKVKWSQTPCYTARSYYKILRKDKTKNERWEGTQLTNPNEAHKWYMEMDHFMIVTGRRTLAIKFSKCYFLATRYNSLLQKDNSLNKAQTCHNIWVRLEVR